MKESSFMEVTIKRMFCWRWDLVVGRCDVVEEVPRGVELLDATAGQDEDLVTVQRLLDVVRDHQDGWGSEPDGFELGKQISYLLRLPLTDNAMKKHQFLQSRLSRQNKVVQQQWSLRAKPSA